MKCPYNTLVIKLQHWGQFIFFSLWLCTFTLSVSIGAALLLPVSIVSNELLLMYQSSYYVKWLNSSLIHGMFTLFYFMIHFFIKLLDRYLKRRKMLGLWSNFWIEGAEGTGIGKFWNLSSVSANLLDGQMATPPCSVSLSCL